MFVEQTLVNTLQGYKELSEITTDDFVLTSNHTYEQVQEIKRSASVGVYRIQTQGNPELYASGDTLFCVRTKRMVYNSDTKTYERKFSSEKWVKAKDLTKNDFVLISKNKKTSTPYTKQIAWLYAKYFLKGYITKNETVIITIPKSLLSTFKKNIKGLSHQIKELKHTYKIEVFDNDFYELCSKNGKRINNDFMQSSDNVLKAFIMSFVENTEKNDNNYYVIKSKDRKFIYQIGQIISNINSFGGYSLFLSGEEKVSYRLLFNDEIPKQANFVCIGNKLYQPVRSVTELSAHRGQLFSLGISSFAVNNIITKGA